MSNRWHAAARENMRQRMLELWADPEFRRKHLARLTKVKRGRLSLGFQKSVQISVKVCGEDFDLVSQVCKSRDLTIAELLRDYIEIGLARDVDHHHYKASK